jgi:hypothetical protein
MQHGTNSGTKVHDFISSSAKHQMGSAQVGRMISTLNLVRAPFPGVVNYFNLPMKGLP